MNERQLQIPLGGCLPFGHVLSCSSCGARLREITVVDGWAYCGDCLYYRSRSNVVERGDVRPFGRGRPPMMQR